MTPSVPSNQEYVRIGFDKIFQGGHVRILVNHAGVSHIGDPGWPRLDEVGLAFFLCSDEGAFITGVGYLYRRWFYESLRLMAKGRSGSLVSL
jgi:hypothetical protein